MMGKVKGTGIGVNYRIPERVHCGISCLMKRIVPLRMISVCKLVDAYRPWADHSLLYLLMQCLNGWSLPFTCHESAFLPFCPTAGISAVTLYLQYPPREQSHYENRTL